MTTIPKIARPISTNDFIEQTLLLKKGVRPSAVEELALLLRGWVDLPGQLIPVLRKILELLQIQLAQFADYLDKIDPTYKDEKYSSLRPAWEKLQSEIIGSAPYASSLGISRIDAIEHLANELIRQIDVLISSMPKATGKRKRSESDTQNQATVPKLRKLATQVEYGKEDCVLLLRNHSDGTLSNQAMLNIFDQIDKIKNAQ